jgi:hypothetical protein
MAKRKAGLHKDVSEIFDGVSLPGRDGAHKPSGVAAPERPKHETPSKPQQEHVQSSSAAKPAAPSHMTPTKPKPKAPAQPVEPPPKPAPPKAAKPKPESVRKPEKQIPGQQVWEQIKGKLFAPKAGVSAQKQKTMVILIPVLFVIMIFAFTRVLSGPSRAKAQPAGSGPTSAVAGGSKDIDWQIPEPYPTELRDPMRIGPVTTEEVATSELVVKGIVYSEDDPSAVVGNQIVHEGDEIMGATVVKINNDSVVFKMNDKEWTQKVER